MTFNRHPPRPNSGSTGALIWAYAFNHDEAIRCFDKALSLDPELAIARWGVAYAIRPNYDEAWERFDPSTSRHPWRGPGWSCSWRRRRATPVERGLIDALTHRFPTDDPEDADLVAGD